MSWFRLDDKFHGNPKVLTAGNAAVGLYVRCASYCADHLTDGRIPGSVARMYGTTREITVLVSTGLWDEIDGEFVMPDYLEYNPSRDQVEQERTDRHSAKVQAGRLGGIASGEARRKQTRSKPEAEAKRNEAPTRPIPKETPPTPQHDSESPRRAGVVDHFIRIGRDQHIASGHTIKSEKGFTEFLAGKARGNPDMDRWLEMFPSAPPDAIAAWLHGDKGSMRYYERADELATITELRPA